MRIFAKKFFSSLQPHPISTIFVPLFAVLTLIAVGSSLQMTSAYKGSRDFATFLNFFISKIIYCWYYLMLAVAIQFLSKKIHLTKSNAIRWVSIHLVVLFLSLSLHQLMALLVDTIIWKGALNVSYINLLFNNMAVWLDFGIYILFLLGFFMIEYQRLNQENALKYSRLELQLLRAELQETRSLVHPHFLFNTLQMISDLIDQNQNKRANQMLATLGNFLRKTVYDNERDETTLEEEVDFLHQYIEIEKNQFAAGLTVREEIDPGSFNAFVPNYLIQSIVEKYLTRAINANTELYELNIDIHKERTNLYIKIEDYGNPVIKDKLFLEDAVFKLAKDRLSLFYESNQSLQIDSKLDGGNIVIIRLPYQEDLKVRSSVVIAEDVK